MSMTPYIYLRNVSALLAFTSLHRNGWKRRRSGAKKDEGPQPYDGAHAETLLSARCPANVAAGGKKHIPCTGAVTPVEELEAASRSSSKFPSLLRMLKSMRGAEELDPREMSALLVDEAPIAASEINRRFCTSLRVRDLARYAPQGLGMGMAGGGGALSSGSFDSTVSGSPAHRGVGGYSLVSLPGGLGPGHVHGASAGMGPGPGPGHGHVGGGAARGGMTGVNGYVHHGGGFNTGGMGSQRPGGPHGMLPVAGGLVGPRQGMGVGMSGGQFSSASSASSSASVGMSGMRTIGPGSSSGPMQQVQVPASTSAPMIQRTLVVTDAVA